MIKRWNEVAAVIIGATLSTEKIPYMRTVTCEFRCRDCDLHGAGGGGVVGGKGSPVIQDIVDGGKDGILSQPTFTKEVICLHWPHHSSGKSQVQDHLRLNPKTHKS